MTDGINGKQLNVGIKAVIVGIRAVPGPCVLVQAPPCDWRWTSMVMTRGVCYWTRCLTMSWLRWTLAQTALWVLPSLVHFLRIVFLSSILSLNGRFLAKFQKSTHLLVHLWQCWLANNVNNIWWGKIGLLSETKPPVHQQHDTFEQTSPIINLIRWPFRKLVQNVVGPTLLWADWFFFQGSARRWCYLVSSGSSMKYILSKQNTMFLTIFPTDMGWSPCLF